MRAPGEMTVLVGKHAIDWAGDADDIERIYELTEGSARRHCNDPATAAAAILHYIAKNGPPKEERQRIGALNWIVYHVLEQPAASADKPGKIRDYFLRSSIKASVDFEGTTITTRVDVAELQDLGEG